MITAFLTPKVKKSRRPKKLISAIFVGLIIFTIFSVGRVTSAEMGDTVSESTPIPTPTSTPLVVGDIWLLFGIDQKIITSQTTTITGSIGIPCRDTVIRVYIDGNVVAEKALPYNSEPFSLNVDFSKCKVGDKVNISREFIGTSIPNLGIWKENKTFIIEGANSEPTPTATPVTTTIPTAIPTTTPVSTITPIPEPKPSATPALIPFGESNIRNHTPIVSKYKETTKRVTGKSLPNATVYVKIISKLYKSTVSEDGTYSITTGKLIANQRIEVYIKNSDGYRSKTKTVTVQPLIKSHTPSIKTPKAGDKVITGKTLKGVKITIKINNKSYHMKSTQKGNYKLKTAKLIKGGIVKVWVSDKKGARSEIKTVIIK